MSKRLLKSTAIVAFMTFVSRLSGLARDMVVARIFGANAATDAFFVAFKIPNLLRRQFAEGAFSQAFVPVFTEYKTTREHEQVRQLANQVAGTLGLILFIVTFIGVIASPILVMFFAWDWWIEADHRFNDTAEMLRFTFPYIFFISLTALAAGVLNSYGKFAVAAFTPVLLNICLIAAALLSARYFDNSIIVLAAGVFVAGLVQLLFQLPFVMRLRLLGMPRWRWRDPGVQKIKNLMIPALFSNSVQQINIVIDVWIAHTLITGSISWLYYADRLVEFPFGVFGVAIATVILPALSSKHASTEPDKFNHMLDWGLRWSLLIGLPSAMGLILLSGPLISTIFKGGEFSFQALHMTQLALVGYSIGLLGFMNVKILSPGYFARQDTKTPMKIAFIAMGFKLIITLILVFGMKHLAYEAPHVGLAVATAVSALLQSWLLFHGLKKEKVYSPQAGWGLFMLRVFLATAVMVLVLYLNVDMHGDWSKWHWYDRVFNLLLWVTVGGVVYFATLLISGLKIKQMIHVKE